HIQCREGAGLLLADTDEQQKYQQQDEGEVKTHGHAENLQRAQAARDRFVVGVRLVAVWRHSRDSAPASLHRLRMQRPSWQRRSPGGGGWHCGTSTRHAGTSTRISSFEASFQYLLDRYAVGFQTKRPSRLT